MRWIYEKKKMICAAAAIVLAVLVTGVTAEKKGMLAQAKIASVQKRMAKEVFRFHVLANSDSEEDQELKMKVKRRNHCIYERRSAIFGWCGDDEGVGENTYG